MLNVFLHRSRIVVKLLLKLGTALLIGLAENCPICPAVRLVIQKLLCASDAFVAPRYDMSIPFKFKELKRVQRTGGHSSFSSICGQFSWKHC